MTLDSAVKSLGERLAEVFTPDVRARLLAALSPPTEPAPALKYGAEIVQASDDLWDARTKTHYWDPQAKKWEAHCGNECVAWFLTKDAALAALNSAPPPPGWVDPTPPPAERVRVFVGKGCSDHKRGTHGVYRFPKNTHWIDGRYYGAARCTLAECEREPHYFRELSPSEFDLMPGEPGYVEPVKQAEPKPDDELARLRARVEHLTTALARSEKEAALLREHIQKRKPRAKKRKAVRRG